MILVQTPGGQRSWEEKASSKRVCSIVYPYRANRVRRTLRGIDKQVAKAENAVARKIAV
jgi:hypothetical protein